MNEQVELAGVQGRTPGHHQCQNPTLQVDSTADQAQTPTEFVRFRLLPAELRIMVWEHAVKGLDERIFHAKPGTAKRNFLISFWNCPRPPAVLHACHDSRAVAKRQLSFIFNDNEGNGMWWNPRADILYFDFNPYRHWFFGKTNLVNRGYILAIQRVAIDWRICLTRQTPRRPTPPWIQPYDEDRDFTLLFGHLLMHYPSIKSLYIFFPEKQYPNLSLPSEPLRANGIPITGLTDITDDDTLLGNGITRLRKAAQKLSLPIHRQYAFEWLCDDPSGLDKISNNETRDFER
ncbi:hypothetical protein VSDG_08533 [Cytospora chrysosperma]|uniref:2EXR domain-containing protein n=1 Tax=Cytospora chrysosperma TaxID=252740 RepID=A0A423VEX5_CYTCH|nr:hypothetical protein VSDG_08533 [Valsa sordida]